MKSIIPIIIMAAISIQALAQQLVLGQDWDKTFPKSEKVNLRKRYFQAPSFTFQQE